MQGCVQYVCVYVFVRERERENLSTYVPRYTYKALPGVSTVSILTISLSSSVSMLMLSLSEELFWMS